MRLFIDCEYNSYKGDLISMALVSEANDVFYEVLECDQIIDPWVEEHVIPKLGKVAIGLELFHTKLEQFLALFDHVTIIADWPDDLMYFCKLIVTGPGERIQLPELTLKFIPLEDSVSDNPHNALADAFDIKRQYLKLMEQDNENGNGTEKSFS